MSNITLKDLKLIAKKYKVQTTGSKKKIVDRLRDLIMVYLSNTERKRRRSPKKRRRSRKKMSKVTLKDLKSIAKKYNVTTGGTKTNIADRLCALRMIYLSNRERKKLLPFCSKNKNTKILKDLIEQNYRKKMP